MSQDKMPLRQNVTGQNATQTNCHLDKMSQDKMSLRQNVTGQNVTGQNATGQNATEPNAAEKVSQDKRSQNKTDSRVEQCCVYPRITCLNPNEKTVTWKYHTRYHKKMSSKNLRN